MTAKTRIIVCIDDVGISYAAGRAILLLAAVAFISMAIGDRR